MIPLPRLITCLLVAALAAPVMAQNAPKKLLEADNPNLDKRLKPSSEQVSFARADGGIEVTVQGGQESYPGIDVTPDGAATWDLSGYGHVFAQVTNTGEKSIGVALRVDNKGSGESWNTEQSSVKPGETKTIKVIFGYAYGGKPSYKLKPEAVNNVKMFLTSKSDAVRSFKILSIEAGGVSGEAPPVNPASIRIVPPGGVMVGPAAKLDPQQLVAKGGTATVEGSAVKVKFDGKGEKSVAIKPLQGKWRLTDYTEVRVKVRNDGKAPVTRPTGTSPSPSPRARRRKSSCHSAAKSGTARSPRSRATASTATTPTRWRSPSTTAVANRH
jgi:hypothetical protein